MDDREILQAILEKVTGLESDMSGVKTEITKIHMTLEHDVSKQLQLLGEGQQMVIDKFTKLDQVAEDVEEIKEKVFALEEASQNQASQIKELRVAK